MGWKFETLEGTMNYQNAVDVIKNAILQSQARAAKAVNQEQLALYFGIGRFISENTRNKNWGTGALKHISDSLKLELPGLRGFSETNLKNMRLFYEAWKHIESNSSVVTDELTGFQLETSGNEAQIANNKQTTIRQLHNFLDTIPNYK